MHHRLIIVAGCLAFVAGCSKDADYYSKHMDEARDKMSECIGTSKWNTDKDCKAAFAGLQKAGRQIIQQRQ